MQATLFPASELEAKTVRELKQLTLDQSIGSAAWRQFASKAALVKALSTGEIDQSQTASSGNNGNLAEIIAQAVADHLPPQKSAIDESQVRAIVAEALAGHTKTVEVKITMPDGETKTVKGQHKDFSTLLQAVGAGVPVYMVGPAGSGKTHAAEAAAKELKLPFYCQSVCQQTTISYLLGYQDANGHYVRSLFREAYEKGGVYLLDEIDNGNANVLAVLNAAVSNGACAFPDGMVARHADFRLVPAANTFGRGGDRKYVGRCAIDGATLDRFSFLTWDYDADLERRTAGNDGWTDTVQKIRQRAAELGLSVIISPRASILGARLLAAGLPEKQVRAMTIYKDLPADTVRKLEN
jgi:cobaltochelatase CobS